MILNLCYIWRNLFLNKKLHILFLCSWFPSRVNPDNGDFVQRHAEAVATKHKVTAIHVITDKNLQSNIEIITSEHNSVRIILGYIRHTKNPFLKYYYFIKIYQIILKKIGEFDLVHLNITYPKGIVGLYLKWFRSKPFIITEHWTDYQYPLNKSISFIRKKITQLIIQNSTFICPVSKKLGVAMQDYGLKGNYSDIPNVVNSIFFETNIEYRNNIFTITHISHMGDEHKNIIGIINTVNKLKKEIPKFKFNLIGKNSIKFKNYFQGLNNINIIDQIPNGKIANYLESSSVFILFSNYENLPCVILEAFACGTPVVSTNVGGIKEYFPENFGYLIPKKDESALYKAILKIYNSKLKIERKEIREFAFNNFSYEIIAQKYSELYLKSLKNK